MLTIKSRLNTTNENQKKNYSCFLVNEGSTKLRSAQDQELSVKLEECDHNFGKFLLNKFNCNLQFSNGCNFSDMFFGNGPHGQYFIKIFQKYSCKIKLLMSDLPCTIWTCLLCNATPITQFTKKHAFFVQIISFCTYCDTYICKKWSNTILKLKPSVPSSIAHV